MARYCTLLKLLVWKNCKVQCRQMMVVLSEFYPPVMALFWILIYRFTFNVEHHPDVTQFPAFNPADSTGTAREAVAALLRSESSRASGNGSWELAWSTQESAPAAFANDATTLMQSAFAGTYTLRQLPSPGALETYLRESARLQPDAPGNGSLVLAGVVLADEANPAAPKVCSSSLKVTLRFPSELRKGDSTTKHWMTGQTFPKVRTSGPRNKEMSSGPLPSYASEGFAGLQVQLSRAVAGMCTKQARRPVRAHRNAQVTRRRRQTSPAAAGPDIRLRRFSYPSYDDDPLSKASDVIVVLIMISFMGVCYCAVVEITKEKEQQLKETMKIMGVSTSLQWMGWFIHTMILLFVIALILLVALKLPTPNGPVLKHSSFLVLLVFLVLFSVSLTIYCFLISTFSSNPTVTGTIAIIIYFILYFIFISVFKDLKGTNEDVLRTEILIFCFFCVGALGVGFLIVLKYEGIGAGQQWSNLSSSPSSDFPVSLGAVWLMLLLSCVVLLLITLYVEAVDPGKYGVAKPWDFLCRSSGRTQHPTRAEASAAAQAQARAPPTNPQNFEAEPEGAKAGVRIAGVSKVFPGNKVAVNNLSLNLYEGQITVLLGHNGAGKTTMISMMTGMMMPTTGTVTVAGHDMSADTQKAREGMGICTQHNVLFEDLTVREHIYFFAQLKGLSGAELNNEIDYYLRIMQLTDKKDDSSKKLSGGMKRKLAVAIALCGKSKVVFLDEPTAGMDPTARRALWDVLQQMKAGRTLLLTTHMMDEADVLGDRIAVMAGGGLQCIGSPFFLKKRYSEGYRLVVVKGKGCNSREVTKLLANHIKGVKVTREAGIEIVYQLDGAQTARFEPMLAELEKKTSTLHVVTFGLSCTTMEDVFLKVSREYEGSDEDDWQQRRTTSFSIVSGWRVTGSDLVCNQVHAMFMKRSAVARSGWVVLVVFLLIPAVVVLLGYAFTSLASGVSMLPELSLSLKSYPSPKTVIAAGNDSKTLSKNYRDLISDGDTTVLDIKSSPSDAFEKHMLDQYDANMVEVREHYIIGASFEKDQMTGWFNDQPIHALPLAMNMLYNAHLKSSGVSINIVNHPLPFSTESQISQLQEIAGIVPQTITIGMMIYSIYFIVFLIKERSKNAKLNQFVAGVNVLIFWGVNFIFDFSCFLAACVLVIIALAIIQVNCFKTDDEVAVTFAVLLCFGCELLPYTYVFSLMFRSLEMGFTVFFFISIIGVFAMNLVLLLASRRNADIARWILSPIPFSTLMDGLNNVEQYCSYSHICYKFKPDCSGEEEHFCCPEKCPSTGCVSTPPNYFQWTLPGIQRHIICFFIWGVFYFLILLLIDSYVLNSCRACLHRCWVKTNLLFASNKPEENVEEDEDVLNEKNKIISSTEQQLKDYGVVLSGVTKYYGNFRAVNDISISVEEGEIFGLLGSNGAGKSSTFKMMTGETSMTKGKGYLMGYNLETEIRKVHKNVGYCPQADALIEEMTIRETLRMYLLLHGYTNKAITRESRRVAVNLKFTEHMDKKVKECSGGNKRKLSLVIALLTDPPVVFLDEPTAGMDPSIRRRVWDALMDVRESGSSVVLTSHSMEECEALCTKIAIMVNGSLKCLGPVQHLKNKFAKEVTLIIKVKMGNNVSQRISGVKDFIGKTFPGAQLKQEYDRLLTYSISSETYPWSKMFGIMEKAKKNLDLEDYSLGQTSLEQVFLHFTSMQVDK